MQEFRVRFVQIPRWQVALGFAFLSALLLGLFLLAVGVFIFVLPVAVVAGALVYFFGGRRKPDLPDGVIEAEYREVSQKQLEKNRE